MSNQVNRAPIPRPKARFGYKPKPAAEEVFTDEPCPEQLDLGNDDGEEANMSHLLPKVMVPFKTRPGETPRKVEIQRKRRLYEQQDLNSLIKEQGLEGVPPPSLFDLDVFDNTDLESRLPAEWVPKTPGIPPALAFTAVFQEDGTCEWARCKVIDHDAATNHYCIIVLPEGGGDWPDQSSEVPVWVPRVALYFAAEDPFMFAKRYAEAHASRARAEALLRYGLYIDSMPTEDIPGLPTEQVNRMLDFALNSKKLKDKLIDSSLLVQEVNLEYARTMNKIIFDEMVKRGQSGCAAHMVSVGEEFPKDIVSPAPHSGTIQIAEYNYPQQFSEFSFRTLLTKSEVIGALSRIRIECSKVLKMSIMSTNYTKSARLDEFEQSQMHNIEQTSNYLKDSWSATLKNAVKAAFKDVGKGWFNLQETNMETFEFSKLKKFLTQMRFMMEDTLRFMVEASLQRFVQFISNSCAARVVIHSTSRVDLEMPVVPPEPGQAPTTGRRPPLLLLELLTNKDNTKFCYSTSTHDIQKKVPMLFDLAITKVQGLPQLDPTIMENLFWASVPTLNSVHPMEPLVVGLREQLNAALAEAMRPLEEYLACFQKHEPLLQLDVDAYVAALENKGEDLTLQEVKVEVKKHSQELEQLIEALPVGMPVGIAYVSVSKTRDMLVKKKEKLVGLLKALCAHVPKRMMQAVTARFQEIDRALRVKTNNLEDVDEARKFIESLPNKIGELMGDLEAAKPWYDSLEGFTFLLSEEDAREKFVGESWPMKLTRLADRQIEALKADEDRYKDEMMEEQDAFRGTVNDLQNLVNTIAGYSDTSKVDAIANEIKALHERLKQADQDAGLFNSREVLLGESVTDYSHVKKIIDQFDPFLQFWTTAAAWKTNHHAWMNNSWEELNGEFVEREVTSAYKVLWKSGKAFTLRALDKIAENCEVIRQEVEDFKKFVPLVQALRMPGMCDRHWDALSGELGFPLHPDKSFNLAKAEEMKLLDHLHTITRVADAAGKEHAIEMALNKMAKEWESTEMAVLDYRETKTYVIKVEEQVTQQLDDHIVMTQSMTFSPYKKPFEERILKWEQQLNLVSEILDQWIQVQRQWMYLEPIFSSEDIMQQLPLEGKRFATVDRMWRKTTDGAKRNPLILKVCASQKLLDQFIEANKLLGKPLR